LYDISNQSYGNKNKKKLDVRSVERGMCPIVMSTNRYHFTVKIYRAHIFSCPYNDTNGLASYLIKSYDDTDKTLTHFE